MKQVSPPPFKYSRRQKKRRAKRNFTIAAIVLLLVAAFVLLTVRFPDVYPFSEAAKWWSFLPFSTSGQDARQESRPESGVDSRLDSSPDSVLGKQAVVTARNARESFVLVRDLAATEKADESEAKAVRTQALATVQWPEHLPDGYTYLTVTESQIHQGTLQLVNKDYSYQFLDTWPMQNVYDLDGGFNVSSTDIVLQEEAAAAANNLLSDAVESVEEAGLYLMNGYRTKETSQELYDEDVKKNGQEHADLYIQLPGYSEHHTGLAFDVGQSSTTYFGLESSPLTDWIYEHAADYGIVLRYPDGKTDITGIAYEPWHFRYVGIPVAVYMYENDLCLEEWTEAVKDYTVDSPLEIETAEGTWRIYYAAYDADLSSIPVPENASYELSGNNVDGFIVTLPPDEES